MIPDTWSFDPVVLGAAGLALVLYARGFKSLRGRGRPDRAPASNALLFAGGIAAGVLSLISPLEPLAENTLLSAHMLQHLLLGDVTPLLLVLGIRGPIAFFFLPAAILRPVARLTLLRRATAFVLRPRVSFAVWAGSLAAWHVPSLYDAALSHAALHRLEHASLFLGGVLLWAQIVDPTGRRRLGAGQRAGIATLALLAGMVLSEILLGAAPLYGHYAGAVDRPFGLTEATDQTWAGLLMMAEQVATLGVAAAVLLWNHVERIGRELEPHVG